jgi:hypothetical protein
VTPLSSLRVVDSQELDAHWFGTKFLFDFTPDGFID